MPIPFERILVRKARDRVAQTAVEGLTDTEWVVEDVGGRGIVDRSRATVLLGAEGRISGRATCNNYTGSYDLEGEDFHTRDIVATNRACVEALARQEAEFLRILRSASGIFATEDGALVISNPSGESFIVRRNQPALLTSDILFRIESMRAWRPS